ncbi:MAG: GMC family oxidoreductase N-terminal domain-containing protein [Deltaproteobacteria bacterium]|nr:GMC family oxidoreductase N-terminal domain-containing protein [Deltaproteobacteria bacterium]
MSQPKNGKSTFSGRTRKTALALAEAVLPEGKVFPGASEDDLDNLTAILENAWSHAGAGYRALLYALDADALLHHRRSFASLTADERVAILERWRHGGTAAYSAVVALSMPLKVSHFDDPRVYGAMGCVWGKRAVADEPQPRWMANILSGSELGSDEEIEADAVVVGSGAGGAVTARELAAKGHAVVVLEEGELFGRQDFDGRALPSIKKFYRLDSTAMTIGNTPVMLPMGITVGGSTTINTGTCFRTPDWILARWARDFGLGDMRPDRLAPYFERVESVLQVTPSNAKYLGGVARVIARGSDALGYSHFPVPRNAPDCDGAGVCDFGCPTGAKRSMNVSYLPLALGAGAQLYKGVRAERVLLDHGSAVGIRARSLSTGKHLTVRARAVVLAGGAVPTPAFLLRQNLANSSGQVGRNLSIHPATMVAALFGEEIRGFTAIPQGYGVDQFHREGILLLGSSAPLDAGAATFPQVGKTFMDLMEAFDRIAMFGAMIEDGPNGRVFLANRRPFVSYWLGRRELGMLQRAVGILGDIYFAAGAKELYPHVKGFEEIRTRAELGRFKNARLKARDFILTGFHPLGSCRMGTDPRRSVVDQDNECHDVPGLFITDGSAVPSSLAVNPQVTIMTLATRAAERIGRKLERSA